MLKKNIKKITSIMLVCTILTGCNNDKVPKLLEPVTVRNEILSVEKRDITTLNIYSGSVTPVIHEVGFETDGIVDEFNYTIGDEVEKGEVIASLYSKDISASISDANKESTYISNMGDYDVKILNKKIEIEKQNIKIWETEITKLQASTNTTVGGDNQPPATTEVTTESTAETTTETTTTSTEAVIPTNEPSSFMPEETLGLEESNIQTAMPTGSEKNDSEDVADKISELQSNIAASNTQISVYETMIASSNSLTSTKKSGTDSSATKLKKKKNEGTLIAPCNGEIVAALNASNEMLAGGDYVLAGKTAYYIADNNDLYVSSDYMIKGDLTNSDRIYAIINGKEYELKEREVTTEENRYAIANNIDIPLKFEFVDKDAKVKAGDYADIYVAKNSKKNVVAVPNAAIKLDGTTWYVVKMDGDKETRQNVEIGVITSLYTEIVDGLKAGDKIAADIGLDFGEDSKITEITKEDFNSKAEVTKYSTVYPSKYKVIWQADNGRLQNIVVKDGDKVKKGDLLANVSMYSNQSAITSANNIGTNATSQAEVILTGLTKEINAKKEEAATLTNQDKKTLCNLEIEELQLEYDKTVYDRDYQVALSGSLVSRLTADNSVGKVVAPISGTVTELSSYSDGHTLEAGNIVAEIRDDKKAYVSISTDLLFRYNSEVTMTGTVDGKEVNYKGRVILAGNALYPDLTGSNQILIKMEGLTEDIKVQDVKITVKERECKDVYVVDSKAVYKDDDGMYVCAYEGDRVVKKYIVIGEQNNGITWILQGIDKETKVALKKE